MDIGVVSVAVVANIPDALTGLVASFVEVGDAEFTGENGRGRRAEVTVEVAETVRRPPVAKSR